MKSPLKIMFLGTGSDVGKSVCATAFCRILKRRGYAVAPFKAQNMSNNSFVTVEGGEIGRAQAVQAEAAGLLPSVRMNPVLLKPAANGCQIVLNGQVLDTAGADAYKDLREKLLAHVMAAYKSLESEYDAIVIEGAGSCCEVNLRANDIVNFELGLRAQAPVVLVSDIDRGGVFAQIVGAMELISQPERDLVAGFLINKFRGSIEMFADGPAFIEQRTGKPVFGVVPHYSGITIDMEDSMSLENAGRNRAPMPGRINIAVVQLPLVSNFTDLEILENEPSVNVCWMVHPLNLSAFDAVIIPGSKSTLHDAQWMRRQGWARALDEYTAQGRGLVLGLCGGYQILGNVLRDDHGRESTLRQAPGLGLLDVETDIDEIKVVRVSHGRDHVFDTWVHGYEIHMGRTMAGQGAGPFLELDSGPDGAVNQARTVFGTYLHGLLDSKAFRQAFLSRLATIANVPYLSPSSEVDSPFRDAQYEALADHFEKYVDVDALIKRAEMQSR
jgi:adenosylcobyric acid synthase